MLSTLQLISLEMLDLVILFALGILGWGVFTWLRAPVPALVGSMVVIGALRIMEIPIPNSPQYITPVVQTVLGLYIGSKLTRNTVRELKSLLAPAATVGLWAITIIFIIGWLLSRLTWLDSSTAILSSSVGGLPEMMILSMESGADLAVVLVMQTLRMFATVALFPLLFQKWFATSGTAVPSHENHPQPEANSAWREIIKHLTTKPHLLLLSLAIAAAGGWFLNTLGVPAGIMVGAMLAVAIASVAGLPIQPLHPACSIYYWWRWALWFQVILARKLLKPCPAACYCRC